MAEYSKTVMWAYWSDSAYKAHDTFEQPLCKSDACLLFYQIIP